MPVYTNELYYCLDSNLCIGQFVVRWLIVFEPIIVSRIDWEYANLIITVNWQFEFFFVSRYIINFKRIAIFQ